MERRGEEIDVGMHRILVLCATFFLVALSSRADTVLAVLASGASLYAALWVYDIFLGKEKR